MRTFLLAALCIASSCTPSRPPNPLAQGEGEGEGEGEGDCPIGTVDVTSVTLDYLDDIAVGYSADMDEVYGPGPDHFVVDFQNGRANKIGTWPLDADENTSILDCRECVQVFLNTIDVTARPEGFLFQQAGTIQVDADPYQDQILRVTLRDVVLRAVTVDPVTFQTVAVPGGDCLRLPTTTIDYKSVPQQWTCDAALYRDGACDCLCGAYDADCNAGGPVRNCAADQVCGFDAQCQDTCSIDDNIGCASGVCIGDYATDLCFSAAARPVDPAPVGGTCTGDFQSCGAQTGFALGYCDYEQPFGCHPRCHISAADVAAAVERPRSQDCDALEFCASELFRPDGTAIGFCKTRAPSTWSCEPLAYEDGATCDCGCGAVDPDCAIDAAPVTGCNLDEICVRGSCGVPVANDTCADAIALAPGGEVVTGDTTTARDDLEILACTNGFYFNDGNDVVYRIDLTAGATLDATLTTPTFDGTLMIVGPGAASLCDTTTTCGAYAEMSQQSVESLTFTAIEAGSYYVVVDAWFGDFGLSSGPFSLTVDVAP